MRNVRKMVLLQLQAAAPVLQLRLVAVEVGKRGVAEIRVQEMLLRLCDPKRDKGEDGQMQKLQIVSVLEMQQWQEMGEGVPVQATRTGL